jgi:predicted phage terminase large subunit-like protein
LTATDEEFKRKCKEEMARRQAKENFSAFVRANPPDENYKWGRHTKVIAQELQNATEAVERGECYYVIINCPPRHGKSTLCSHLYPVWHLIRNPDHEIMMTSYGATLCKKNSRTARSNFSRIADQYGLGFQSDHNEITDWGIADGEGNALRGSVKAVSIDSGATGAGANILICDDYLKGRASADSLTIRNRTWEEWQDSFMTRLAPAHAVIILATRWHEDDPDGRIKKQEEDTPGAAKFKRIIFPALGDEQTDYNGQWLFPERFSEDWYLLQKAKGAYSWGSLFQQSPVARTGNQIKIRDYQIIDGQDKAVQEYLETIRFCRGWDVASTDAERNKDDPDWTAGIRAGIDSDGWLVIADCVAERLDAPERDQLIESTMLRDGYGVRQYFEAVGGYIDTVRRLQKKLAGKCVIEEVRPKGDKTVRAAILEAFFESGMVKFVRGPWLDALVAQLAAFPNAPHDDMVDAMVYAVFKLIDPAVEEFVC